MPKTLVRPAHSTDFRILLEIDQLCFEPGIAYDSAELSYFMKRPGARTLVVEVNGRIAGFLLMELMHRRRQATIITLDVREEHRGQGCGTELLRVSEEILRQAGIRTYYLQVDVNNSRAIAFYKRHGFQVARTLPEYYANGNDAYLMIKEVQ